MYRQSPRARPGSGLDDGEVEESIEYIEEEAETATHSHGSLPTAASASGLQLTRHTRSHFELHSKKELRGHRKNTSTHRLHFHPSDGVTRGVKFTLRVNNTRPVHNRLQTTTITRGTRGRKVERWSLAGSASSGQLNPAPAIPR